jgi:molybdopterin-guanine dinucleotide biosynthesis protein A
VTATIDGLVLAGGRSRRFGSDKRIATFEGVELVRRAYDTLCSVVDGVVFVATGAERERLPGIERAMLLVDEMPDRGPLGGLAAGLRHSRRGVLVLAADLPRIKRSTLEAVARVGRSSPRAVALRGIRGWEPLVAWYPRSALETVVLVMRSPRPAPFLVLERLGAQALPILEADEFINVNTPEDLRAAIAASARTQGAES